MFVCIYMFKTNKTFDRFTSNYDWEIGKTQEMFLAWFKDKT